MARLAAYYQEDFHYPPVGYTSKQRKSAYVVYEDANGNISQPPVYGYPDRGYPDNRMSYLKPPQPHKVKHKHSKKRFSYADSYVQRDVGECYTDDDYYYVPAGYEDGYYLQPVYQRDMRWVPGYLSPPSPLVDSGLSSQSSPSLETFQCSCSPRLEEPPQRCASRYDSGRPDSRMMDSCRTDSRMMDRPGSRMMDHGRPESQMTDYVPQIRYGKLGIVGEPPPEPQRRRRASEREASPVQESGGSASPPPSESSAASGSSACSSGGRVAGEREIRELEAMLARCGLTDRDLLDRAERRDLPTAHQRLARSRSDTFLFSEPAFELRQPRAPPRRRAGLPDRVADDMALRKQRQIPRPPRPTALPSSYLLCSPHFTPTVSPCVPPLPWQSDLPDADMDDLAYRRHYLGRSTSAPQPPFGIPLRPPPLERRGSRADYLHVEPSRAPQPLCHPRGNPDVVRDDMAFRTLRKDEPERIYCDIAQMYERRR